MKIGDLVHRRPWSMWPIYRSPREVEGGVGVVVHVYAAVADPVGAGTSIDVMWEDGVYTMVAGHVEVINEYR